MKARTRKKRDSRWVREADREAARLRDRHDRWEYVQEDGSFHVEPTESGWRRMRRA